MLQVQPKGQRETPVHYKTSSWPHLAQPEMIPVSMAWEVLSETRWLFRLREGITLEMCQRLKVLLKKNPQLGAGQATSELISTVSPLLWTRTQCHYLNTKLQLRGRPWGRVSLPRMLSKQTPSTKCLGTVSVWLCPAAENGKTQVRMLL